MTDYHTALQSKENQTLVLCEGDANEWSVGITRATIERILKSGSDDPGDMIALWMFYAYTCRWQKVNQARATVGYVGKGLGWSEQRVKKARNSLKELGLIDDVQDRDADGKVAGWYVAVRYLATSPKIHRVDCPPGGESHPKCSSSGNGNAQELSKKEDLVLIPELETPPKPKRDVQKEAFEGFWADWPKKVARAAAWEAWKKIKRSDYAAVFDGLDAHLDAGVWEGKEPRYIPNATTWLNQQRWNDEVPTVKPKGVPGTIGNPYL